MCRAILSSSRSGAGPGHGGQHLGPRRLEVEDDAVGAAGAISSGATACSSDSGSCRDAAMRVMRRRRWRAPRLALLAQQRARLQEEGGVVGEGADDALVARPGTCSGRRPR
jgi:hypothetical protein